MTLSERSVLRVRVRPHFHPDRQNETVCEVLRDGEVVATIYGSREGLHITSNRLRATRPPFYFEASLAGVPSYVVPLLKSDEPCPWCDGAGLQLPVCPVCGAEKRHG